jgi:hypothetical protein
MVDKIDELERLILLVLYINGKMDWEKIKYAVYILNKILNENKGVV